MTGPRFTPDSAEPAPAVLIDPEVRTGAGSPAALRLMITNRATEPRVMAVTALGVDAAWLPRPVRSAPVMPGESIALDLVLAPAAGTVPARYPLAVAVEALDPGSGSPATTAVVDVVLVVDEPSQIAIELDPPAATAVFRRAVTVTVRNTGTVPAAVRLEARSPAGTDIELREDVVVGPGQALPVPGRIRVRHPKILGQRARHTYTVTARSSGAPRHVEGSLTVRAVLGPSATKAIALLGVVAVWVALAVIFIPKLADHVKHQNAASTTQTATSSAAPGKGSGKGGSSGSGAGSSGSAGSGSGGSGSGSHAASAAGASSVQLNGTVTGNSPAGVDVAISPTSLVDEKAAGATEIGFSSDATEPVGKVPGGAVLLTAARTVLPDRAVTTGADGAWSFAGVTSPGYYLLTFAKPGYQTQRYIVDASAQVATQPLKVELSPGQGSLHGVVTGPDGPVGAAQVTITDGTNTITTSSNSKGAIGTWTVTGLSTPSSFLVTATKDGMSAESDLVTLAAGGDSTVDLDLKPGVAALTGKISGTDSTGAFGGIGNVGVTVTNGTVTRTASTVTTGSLLGHYTLPDLAPGVYTITMRADGYLTQTRQVTIAKGQSKAAVNATLNSSAAIVTGTVKAGGKPVNGAGLILTNADNTYKITSSADGSFRFNGVAPGVYVLSAQYSGLTTSYRSVTAVVGKTSTSVTFALEPETTVNTSTITGYVGSATTSGGTLGCHPGSTGGTCEIFFTLTDSDGDSVPVHLADGQPYQATSTITPADSGPTPYTLSAEHGLAPGLYHLTIGSTGYLPATITVRVPLNGVATAPQVSLYPANIISGTINALGDVTTGLDGTAYRNCVWAIPEGYSDPTGTITQPPTSCPTGSDAPSQDGCSSFGHAAPGVSVIAKDDTYSIGGLCDGTYNVYVFIQNPAYGSPPQPASETVSHGETRDYSPHVPRKARVVLTVHVLDPSTGDVSTDTGAMTISSVTCTPATPDSVAAATGGVIKTDGSGRLTVSGMDASSSGACVANVSAADSPTGKPMTGGVSNLSLAADTDTAATITLTQGLGAVIGRVVSPYGGATDNPVQTSVSVVGTIGYDGTDPLTNAPATVTTDVHGCFAIVHDTDSVEVTPPSSDGCGSGPLPRSAVAVVPLVSPSVSLSVAATVGTSALQSSVTVNPATVTTLSVAPLPASTSALVLSATDPATLNLAAASVQVTSRPTGAGTVTVDPDSAGNLIWNDTNVGVVNEAWPGTYTLSATLPGYTTATATVRCPLPTAAGAGCTVDAPFVLTALGTLSGTVSGYDKGADTSTPLVGATVTATCLAGSLAPCASAGTTITATTDSSGRYSFTGTSTHFFMARDQWSLSVSATGYTPGPATATVSHGENTKDITLNALGKVSGYVTGQTAGGASSVPLPGATVTATCLLGSLAPCSGNQQIRVLADSAGFYSFTGSSSPYFMAAGMWTFTVSAAGYPDTTFPPVEITSGSNTVNQSLDALGALSGKVTGLAGAPLPGATVTATCANPSSAGSPCPADPVVTTTDLSGHYTLTGSDTNYSLPLADWTLTVTATGYLSGGATTTVLSGPNTQNITLSALGALSGSVSGLLARPAGDGTDQSKFTQKLSGATVIIKPCSGDRSSCPTGDLAETDSGTTTVTTDTFGNYSFAGTSTPYTLTPGSYQLTVRAFGYAPTTTAVDVAGGPNTAAAVTLAVRPVDLPIGVRVSGSGGALTTHVTIKLTRTDDSGTSITLDSTDAGSDKLFHVTGGLIPATYSVTIAGDDSSIGSSILGTTGSITVPLSDTGTAAEADIPVTVVQSTVTGVVTGPSGQSGTAKLGGVQAELGTLDGATGDFTVSQAANGSDLVVTSADGSGKITFTGVPNGTYVARINHLGPLDGYGELTTASVTVGYGQTQPLPAISLPQVTRDVTVKVTTSDAADTLSGVAVALRGASDHTWEFSASTPAHDPDSTVWTWDLGQVPAGSWTLSIPLPADHYGTPAPSSTSGGPAVTCGSTSPVTCTSGTVTVSGDPTDSTGLALNYDLDEYQPGVAVTVHALPLDTAPPSTVSLSVAGTSYTDDSFGVSSTSSTLPIWVDGSHKITVDAGSAGWPAGSFMATAADPSDTIALTEVGGSVTVQLAASPAFPGTATISLVPPAGAAGVTAPATQQAAAGDSVTFEQIPYGSGWKAHATVTYTPIGSGSPPPVTLDGDSSTFTVSATSPPGAVPVTLSP